jgi:hypothetical protein
MAVSIGQRSAAGVVLAVERFVIFVVGKTAVRK